MIVSRQTLSLILFSECDEGDLIELGLCYDQRAINCEGSGRCPVQPRDQCAVVVLTLIDHPLFETETLLEPC